MIYLLWPLNFLISLAIIPGGIIGLVALSLGLLDPEVLILCIIAGIIGLVIGFTNWALEVPPRWFWKLSPMQLLSNRFGTALWYGVGMFCLAICIWVILLMV
ncbi:MAG: hypothetical protein HUK18_06020 [Bacteroidales bacterium]|nr:hypothetical protein [Bacteroidales bacterium]